MKNLKSLRESNGLTADYLAKLLGIDTVTYEKYENDSKEINLYDLIRLAYCFNTSIDYLADFTDEPCPHPRKQGGSWEKQNLTDAEPLPAFASLGPGL